MTSKENNSADRNKRKRLFLLVLLFLLIFGSVAGVLGKYVFSSRQQAAFQAESFHIDSDLLEKGGQASLDCPDWTENGISVRLYNYELGNPAQVSETDISYTVEYPSGWSLKIDGQTAAFTRQGGVNRSTAVFEAGNEGSSKQLLFTCTDYAENTGVQPENPLITVKTTAPYSVSLGAVFRLSPGYPYVEIEDMGSYIEVTVKSNGYCGDFPVSWSEGYSPDNTNPLMENWQDSLASYSLSLERNTVYSLTFFKNTQSTLNVHETTALSLSL